MSSSFEVPSQSMAVEMREASHLRALVDSGKRLVGRGALVLSLVTGLVVAESIGFEAPIARADDGGYPDAGVDDCSSIFGIYSWCKDKNNNGVFNSGEQYSSRGYDYRNCTDWVAWRIPQLTGKSVPSGLGNASDWNDKAPSEWVIDTVPEVGDIAQSEKTTPFGHVGVVEEVSKNGDGNITSIKVSEYNRAGSGNYTISDYASSNGTYWRGTAHTKKWDKFLDLNGTGVGGSATTPTTPLRPTATNTVGWIYENLEGDAGSAPRCQYRQRPCGRRIQRSTLRL